MLYYCYPELLQATSDNGTKNHFFLARLAVCREKLQKIYTLSENIIFAAFDSFHGKSIFVNIILPRIA